MEGVVHWLDNLQSGEEVLEKDEVPMTIENTDVSYGRRRPETISSSSAASADEPSTPLGLGERRMGDAVLSDPVDVEVAEGGVDVPLVLGRTIGARGCPMRPTSGAGIEPILFELEQCQRLVTTLS